jgi:hypothetical protein
LALPLAAGWWHDGDRRGRRDRILAYWIGRIARRYNQQGPDGVKDRRQQSRPGRRLLLSAAQPG